MDINKIVDLSLVDLTQGGEEAGQNVAMLLSPNFPAGTDVVRLYSGADEMDGDYETTDPEYLAAQVYFGQTPRPATLALGKMTSKPTQRYRVDVVAVANSTEYMLKVSNGVNEEEISITSGGAATNDAIISALVDEFNEYADAGSIPTVAAHYTAAIAGDPGATYMTITSDTAGVWLSVAVDDTARLAIFQNHASPAGLGDDLNAIKRAGYDWYGVANLFNSTAMVAAIGAWVESNLRLYAAAINDTEAENGALSGADDAAAATLGSSLRRTGVLYHPSPAKFADMGALGYLMATDPPGSATLHAKVIATVPVDSPTDTQIANLEAKRCSFITRVAGRNLLIGGYTGTSWFDEVQGLDYYMEQARQELLADIANNKKIPYDEGGFAIIEAAFQRAFAKGEVGPNEFFVPGSVVITMPKLSSISSVDRAARRVPDIAIEAEIAGAVHKVSGTVTAIL